MGASARMDGRPAAQVQRSTETEIRSLIARLDSTTTRDSSLVSHLFADSFYIVHGNGRILRKAAWLAQRARLRIKSTEWEQLQVFDYGSVALAVGAVRRQYDLPDGTPVDEQRRMTYVWVRRGERWQLAAMHGTRIER